MIPFRSISTRLTVARCRPAPWKMLAAAALVLGLFSACSTDVDPAQLDYDERHPQVPVTRHAQLDSVIGSLASISFSKLPQEYLAHAGIDKKWAKDLRKKSWFVIHGEERYRYLVGTFRIRDFMAHMATVANPAVTVEPEDQGFLCMDPRVLHKLLDLLTWMQKKGMDTGQLMVNYGFRHPALNDRIKGAVRSRHQWGEAIDLVVGDVNRDGKVDDGDKQPLLAVLDQQIIGGGGGVGKYPGTQVIHMDVRGFRARWDHQKPR